MPKRGIQHSFPGMCLKTPIARREPIQPPKPAPIALLGRIQTTPPPNPPLAPQIPNRPVCCLQQYTREKPGSGQGSPDQRRGRELPCGICTQPSPGDRSRGMDRDGAGLAREGGGGGGARRSRRGWNGDKSKTHFSSFCESIYIEVV